MGKYQTCSYQLQGTRSNQNYGLEGLGFNGIRGMKCPLPSFTFLKREIPAYQEIKERSYKKKMGDRTLTPIISFPLPVY